MINLIIVSFALLSTYISLPQIPVDAARFISSTFLNLYYSAGGFENTFCCGIRRPHHLGNEIDWPVFSASPVEPLRLFTGLLQDVTTCITCFLKCFEYATYLLCSLPFSASLSSSSSSRACMNGACTCFSTSKFNVPDVAVACHTHSNNPKLAKYLTWPTMTCNSTSVAKWNGV